MSSSEFHHRDQAGGASEQPSAETMRRCRKIFIYLIMQFLREEKFEETIHMLEQESALYFDMNHLEKMVLAGNWDELEKYLSGFTKLEDNEQSLMIFFLIRRQKYLEALDRKEKLNALDIVMKDLKVFEAYYRDQFNELANLLTLEDIRENNILKQCEDIKSLRAEVLKELKKFIEMNPLFLGKLQFPNFANSRLKALISRSELSELAKSQNPMPQADGTSNFPHRMEASPAPLIMRSTQGDLPQRPPHIRNSALTPRAPLYSWTASSSKITSILGPTFPGGPIFHCSRTSSVATLNLLPSTSSNRNAETCSSSTSHLLQRERLAVTSKVPLPWPESSTSRGQHGIDELPTDVAATLVQGYTVTSIDFHPYQPTLLLVGTSVGDISIWDVSRKELLVHSYFRFWNFSAYSTALKSTLAEAPLMSVNRVRWSDEGREFGVAYSKNLMHLFTHNELKKVVLHLEIDSHDGGVNDIDFWKPNGEFFIVTCGDDKTIKVWDAFSGVLRHSYEGHKGPVFSICPHSREKFIISASFDGKIMVWLYSNWCFGGYCNAIGQCCTSLSYGANGSRLFSSGITKDGDSYIGELCEKGNFIRVYSGFGKSSKEFMQFDTAKSKFLAAGDEFLIKFWDMEIADILTIADAGGVLPASPRLCFNNLGSLLAVSTKDCCIRILANAEGFRLLQASDNQGPTGS